VAVLAVTAIVSLSQGQAPKPSEASSPEKQILNRLAQIQQAAEALDAEKVFSFVMENDKGALVQNGRLLLTRSEAFASTKRGFEGLQKVSYQIDQQHISLLSPTIALAIGEGVSFATTREGTTFNTPFTQTVVLVLTNSEWKVFHAHRSFPTSR
jgi:hypothetical protein